MKHLIGFAGVFMLANLLPAAKAATQSVEAQIAEAVSPLPEDLRAGATVVTYDPESGARHVLRQGTNSEECEPRNPDDGFIRCYNKVTVPRREMEAKLKAEKKSQKEIQAAIADAIKAGTLKVPPFGTMSYRLATKDGVIKHLWVMSVPYATPEQLGVSTVSQRDAALKGHGLPWMMLPGTAGAHIMIPINDRP
jgi:hypothetical protein